MQILNKQQMYSLGSIFLPNHYNFLLDFIVTLHDVTAEIQNCQSCLSQISSQSFKSIRLPVTAHQCHDTGNGTLWQAYQLCQGPKGCAARTTHAQMWRKCIQVL